MQSKKNKPHYKLPFIGGVAILITFILAAGCTGQVPESRLNGTEWSFTGYVQNGSAVLALAGSDVTLAFGNGGLVSGSAGCNRYFSTYDVKGTTITLGPAGSTMMYCGQPGVMEQESTYLALFNQAKTFSNDGDRLYLFDAKGTKILSFAKSIPPEPKSLVKTNWTLASVHTANAVSSVIADTTVTAVFGDDGRVSGSAGCNCYFATYDVKGTTITIGQAGSTRMYCGQPGVMEQETTYLKHLNNTRSYTLEGNSLALFDETGGRILTFSAIP
ncbi:MAG: META domain-containing protein [Methanoregula sp.]|nr:META domain-containing protein [Methanoregula sp.]